MAARSSGVSEATASDVVEELRTSNHLLTVQNRLLAVMATRGMEQRLAVLMLDSVGLQPKQIAAVLGATPNSVSVALHRARKAAQARPSAIASETERDDGDE
jgi:DNA-directed RNA polymerase specialized sigma24 family protein